MELGVGSFGFVPFWYGKKLAAVATNYIPSPTLTNPAAAASTALDNPINATLVADGPVISQEWWIVGTAASAVDVAVGVAVDPTAAASWMRPYTAQTQLSGNAGIDGQAAAPMGFMMTHAPLSVAQTVMPTPGWPSDGLFWLWKGVWLGLMNWRVGGVYSPGQFRALKSRKPFLPRICSRTQTTSRCGGPRLSLFC